MNLVNSLKVLVARTSVGKLLQNQFGSQGRLSNSHDLLIADGLKVNLGCGEMHFENYINIDVNDECNPDLQLSAQQIAEHFEPNSLSVIQFIHGIGYLSFKDAQNFFNDVHHLLTAEGVLVIETPSIELISKSVLASGEDLNESEIFPIFATSAEGGTHGETYQFIWTRSLLTKQLKRVGFTDIRVENPLSHGMKKDRDIRIVATKHV